MKLHNQQKKLNKYISWKRAGLIIEELRQDTFDDIFKSICDKKLLDELIEMVKQTVLVGKNAQYENDESCITILRHLFFDKVPQIKSDSKTHMVQKFIKLIEETLIKQNVLDEQGKFRSDGQSFNELLKYYISEIYGVSSENGVGYISSAFTKAGDLLKDILSMIFESYKDIDDDKQKEIYDLFKQNAARGINDNLNGQNVTELIAMEVGGVKIKLIGLIHSKKSVQNSMEILRKEVSLPNTETLFLSEKNVGYLVSKLIFKEEVKAKKVSRKVADKAFEDINDHKVIFSFQQIRSALFGDRRFDKERDIKRNNIRQVNKIRHEGPLVEYYGSIQQDWGFTPSDLLSCYKFGHLPEIYERQISVRCNENENGKSLKREHIREYFYNLYHFNEDLLNSRSAYMAGHIAKVAELNPEKEIVFVCGLAHLSRIEMCLNMLGMNSKDIPPEVSYFFNQGHDDAEKKHKKKGLKVIQANQLSSNNKQATL